MSSLAGTSSWKTISLPTAHHPEWSNHPYFGVATVDVKRAWVENPAGYGTPEGVGEVYKSGAEMQERICLKVKKIG